MFPFHKEVSRYNLGPWHGPQIPGFSNQTNELQGLNSVFDIMQANDFAKEFDDYGKEKIEFAELAKIWEDNKYEVRVSHLNVCSCQIFAP